MQDSPIPENLPGTRFRVASTPAPIMIQRELDIINRLGLHARAAAKFCTCANGFQSSVRVSRDGRDVSGKSVMGLMMLAASCGTRILVEVDGEDEAAVVEALTLLVADRFGEGE